jgi:hypothetical protein
VPWLIAISDDPNNFQSDWWIESLKRYSTFYKPDLTIEQHAGLGGAPPHSTVATA